MRQWLDDWRKSNARGVAFPEKLWASAGRLAQWHGMFRTARALGRSFETIEALFGREGENGVTEHQRGALMFWDVIPQIKVDSLKVEVMTPHQNHYWGPL